MSEERLMRLARLREHLKERELEGLVVVRPENRYYFSGFVGTAGALVITADRACLCVDFRYEEQARQQAPEFEVITGGVADGLAIEQLKQLALKKVGFEDKYVNVALYQRWKENLPNLEFVPMDDDLTRMRMVKSPAEVERIAKAADLGDRALQYVLEEYGLDHTELELAWALEKFMRENGAEGLAFDTIVASGPTAAKPHAQPSQRRPEPGDLLVMDFGAQLDYYCSDMTRTLVKGPASDKAKEIYGIVLEAQLAALAAIAPGVTGHEVDKVARDIITAAGYGQHFGHGLGHGVGLLIHESPGLGPGVQTILEPGMVVTVEPGIYLPGFGGVRIEDLVVVTEDGCRILTKTTKELTCF
jgi:Xaa-Pro aminopeptidase